MDGAALVPGGPASAQPPLALGPPVLVTGTHFFAGCQDTLGTRGSGCSGGPAELPPQTPARQVHLVLSQGASSWDLGTADADPEDSAISWRATLPPQVQPGPARLDAGGLIAFDLTVDAAGR